MRQFGLIGFPLTHSFSANYFRKKFSDLSIHDAEYSLFPLEDISLLPELIRQHPDLQGFNVTIPYKISIISFLNHVSKVAAETGAVNCVKIVREGTKTSLNGFNTDIYGFRESLLPLLKPYHYNALILGTGGAAQAVAQALLELGIAFTMVSRKNNQRDLLNYAQLTKEIIDNNLLIINATPLGMFPSVDKYPDIPYRFLNSKHLLIDLVYNPAETQFMKKGAEYGASVKNGLQMLELQADKSWEIWNA